MKQHGPISSRHKSSAHTTLKPSLMRVRNTLVILSNDGKTLMFPPIYSMSGAQAWRVSRILPNGSQSPSDLPWAFRDEGTAENTPTNLKQLERQLEHCLQWLGLYT